MVGILGVGGAAGEGRKGSQPEQAWAERLAKQISQDVERSGGTVHGVAWKNNTPSLSAPGKTWQWCNGYEFCPGKAGNDSPVLKAWRSRGARSADVLVGTANGKPTTKPQTTPRCHLIHLPTRTLAFPAEPAGTEEGCTAKTPRKTRREKIWLL